MPRFIMFCIAIIREIVVTGHCFDDLSNLLTREIEDLQIRKSHGTFS